METPARLKQLCGVLTGAGFQAWLVGGAVRDLLLGCEAHDWDVATDALPEQVVALFPRVIPTGIQHGTVTVLLGPESFEVTTFRGEGVYLDGRRPEEVHFLKDIQGDLARRDFTINAMAMGPLTGGLADPFGGARDLREQILRAVGNPLDRFAEDGLRVLRGCRFAARYGLQVDPQTLQAMGAPRSLEALSKVAPERVQQEVVKCMAGMTPSVAFSLMEEAGILSTCLPELMPMVGCDQNQYHSYDVWRHTLSTVNCCGPWGNPDPLGAKQDPVLQVAALLHDIGKPASRAKHPLKDDWTFYDHEHIGADMARALLDRLRFSADDRNRIVHLVKHHYIRYESDWQDSAVRRWVQRVGVEHVNDLLILARADILGKGPAKIKLDFQILYELKDRVEALQAKGAMVASTKGLAIGGSDVMDHLKIGPGPKVGAILKGLLERVTEVPEDNTRDRLLALAEGLL